ncbi:hypothetical protein ACS0TY_036671 [Phlomoides rotata]
MVVDPYEYEVPELVDDGNDDVDSVDGFIDHVEFSHAWTTMRDNLAMQMFAHYISQWAGTLVLHVAVGVEKRQGLLLVECGHLHIWLSNRPGRRWPNGPLKIFGSG